MVQRYLFLRYFAKIGRKLFSDKKSGMHVGFPLCIPLLLRLNDGRYRTNETKSLFDLYLANSKSFAAFFAIDLSRNMAV
jgi:hypothetical protein